MNIEAKEITVTNFNLDSIIRVYKSKSITTHCERFVINSNFDLKKVRLGLLSNKTNTSCIIKIYKYEGQQSVPRSENEVIPEILVKKEKIGYEDIEVNLSQVLNINNEQVFVCIESISDGLYLITDDTYKQPYCRNEKDVFTNQMQKDKSGRWFFSNFSYSISLYGEELEEKNESKYFKENTSDYFEKGILDTINNSKFKQITVFDAENDGLKEIIINNIAFTYNTKSQKFVKTKLNDILSKTSIANYVFDFNGDNKLDLLVVDKVKNRIDSNKFASNISIYDNIVGDKKYKVLSNEYLQLSSISSIYINDLNIDGKEEIVITQNSDTSTLRNYYLTNQNNHLQLNDLLNTENVSTNGVFSFVFNNSGDKQVSIFNNKGVMENWTLNNETNEKHSKKRDIKTKKNSDSLINVTNSYDIAVVNNLNNLDGTTYLNNTLYKQISRKTDNGLISFKKVENQDSLKDEVVNTDSWIIANTGIASGDIDNDGDEDVILFTEDSCYCANLLINQNGNLVKQNATSGFNGYSLGKDGILTDINQDGKLDLLTFSNGKFTILTNTSSNSNQFVGIIDKSNSNYSEGSTFILYSGNDKLQKEYRTNYSWFMQSPKEVHFGLDNRKNIDSLYVTNEKGTKIFYDLKINEINDLSILKSKTFEPNAEISSFPNPFTTSISIELQSNIFEDIDVNIVDVNGNITRDLFNGKLKSHKLQIDWNGYDNQGNIVRNGTYFVTFNYKDKSFTSKIVKVQ